MPWNETIVQHLRAYYEDYYRNALNLPQWRELIDAQRLREEDVLGSRFIKRAEECGVDFKGRKVLVVGAGTGSESFALVNKHTNDVYMLESYNPAVVILRLKAAQVGIEQARVIESKIEDADPSIGRFDVVICNTVLEHVDEPRSAIQKMNSLLAPGGKLLLCLPNYLFPAEPHYKVMTFPPRLFPSLARWHLKRLGRYTSFFETLNFLSARDLDRILFECGIKFTRHDSFFSWDSRSPGFKESLVMLYSNVFQITKDQFIVCQSSTNEKS